MIVVEVAAIVCGSMVAVIGMSLTFVKMIQDREAKGKAKPGTVIYPFNDQKACLMCGAHFAPTSLGHDSAGPSQPVTCNGNRDCPANPEAHLHVHCGSCHSDYLMRPLVRSIENLEFKHGENTYGD